MEKPHAEALVEITQTGVVGQRWTYGELLEDSERLARALNSRFKLGEHIAVWAPNSPEWVLMEYACALAGLVLVTANPAFQVNELRYVLEHSGAVGLFTVKEFRGNPMTRIAGEAASGSSAIREIIDLDDTKELFTSVTQKSTWINIMPMFHTSGCGMVTLGCLQAGCRMVLVSLFDPDVINQIIEKERATIILGVPTMVIALMDAFEALPVDVSSLQLVSCGGAMVAPELVRRVRKNFNCYFSTLYGQTEYSPVITQHHTDDTLDDICDTAGQPIPQTDISIRHIQNYSIAALGEGGEICVRGPCTMLEYYRDDEATMEAIDNEGWLHTGDLGPIDSRGDLRITGRVKEMIIRGGENHFPAEIENILLEHDSIAEVAVVGLPDDKWGEIIAAFIRTDHGDQMDIEAFHNHCRAWLAPQKTPTIWCRVDDFPMTGSRKIQKYKLRDGFFAGEYVGERI